MSIVASPLLTAKEFAELPQPADGSKQELVRKGHYHAAS